jgi:hypothetical protein
MTMSHEYLEQIVDEIYDICTKGIDWPHNFTPENRIKMLQSLINYYQALDTKEGYRRCAKLRDIINMIKLFKDRSSHKDAIRSGSIDIFKN